MGLQYENKSDDVSKGPFEMVDRKSDDENFTHEIS